MTLARRRLQQRAGGHFAGIAQTLASGATDGTGGGEMPAATRTRSQIGKASSAKGKTFEREVVNAAIAAGLDARRTAPMQSNDGSATDCDVTIAGLRCECKHHRQISGWPQLVTAALLGLPPSLTREQQAWLAGHDALILKLTGWAEPLVILRSAGTLRAVSLTRFLAALRSNA